MTPFASLILPIVVAAVAVFILSSIIHMAMPWHKSDYGNVPDDDAAMAAVRTLNLSPGDYTVPNPRLPGGGKNPDFMANFAKGPSFVMTVAPTGPMNMGRYMGSWFAFTLLVSVIAAFATSTVVPPGGNDHLIFHEAALVTAVAYSLGAWPLSIWYHRKWSTAFKSTFDAILYGLATGLIFSWMWPKV